MPTTETTTLAALTGDLRAHSLKVTAKQVSAWPPWKRKSAFLWVRLQGMKTPPKFEAYIMARSKLRSCRVCGCTEDFACVDPGMGYGCSWVGPDLCSACVGKDGP